MPTAPDRPARLGKHHAAHKATRAARLRNRLRLSASSRPGLRRHAGTVIALGGVLVAGITVSGASFDAPRETAHAATKKRQWKTDASVEREAAALPQVSRNAIRSQIEQLRPTDKQTRSELGGGGVSSADDLMPDDPRAIARQLLPKYGWGAGEFECLDQLWIGESNWEVDATNPTSGAYGIPQALPAEKMASFGSDWRTNPVTQIEWGLWYIDESYGSPCSANEFKTANNWY